MGTPNTGNLTPFKPGQSGNPSGKPKGTSEFRELCRSHTPDCVARLRELLDHKDGRVAVRAAEVLLDRGWGKPAQTVRVEESKSPEWDASDISTETLEQMAVLLAREATRHAPALPVVEEQH